MFDAPDAKRVRRSDLVTHSQSASPAPLSPDPDLEKAFQARLATLYGPIPSTSTPLSNGSTDQDNTAQDTKEQEFEFRLFSTAPTTTANTDTVVQKILLNDEESEEEDSNREGRFLRPRPRSHYFAVPASEERKKEYVLAALDGDEVFELARKRAWGLEVPWRVKVLRITASKNVKPKSNAPAEPGTRIEVVDEDAAQAGKKTKPGKKRRIILRENKRKRDAAEEGRKKREEEKEAAEREKRTRRNREKKVKRKLKEKAKKAGATNGFDGAELEGTNEPDVDINESGDD